MVIGLMGFEFESANKGCEALSYSFLSILLQVNNTEDLLIYDFSNQGVGQIKYIYPELNVRHIFLKIKDLSLSMIRALRKCDCVFDITMGDSFSDIYSKEVCLSDMRFKKMAQIFAKRYILLPQTYGPFNDPKVLKKAKKILDRATEIYCRDEMSKKYLSEVCRNDRSQLTTDVAFLLPYNKELYKFDSKKYRLGINVSGLLWRGGFTENNQFDLTMDYQKYIKSLLSHYVGDASVQIYLIPHVIDMLEEAHDDDYKVCLQLLDEFVGVEIAPKFLTPMEAKSFISNMDCFIGARMHSTVAAISSGVATIPVSYSRKFEGLYSSINYPYIINGKKMNTDEAYESTIEYINKATTLKIDGEKSILLTKSKLSVFIDSIIRQASEIN